MFSYSDERYTQQESIMDKERIIEKACRAVLTTLPDDAKAHFISLVTVRSLRSRLSSTIDVNEVAEAIRNAGYIDIYVDSVRVLLTTFKVHGIEADELRSLFIVPCVCETSFDNELHIAEVDLDRYDKNPWLLPLFVMQYGIVHDLIPEL